MIYVEGPDYSGKTTFIRDVLQPLGYEVETEAAALRGQKCVEYFANLTPQGLRVYDRGWISEWLYSPILRTEWMRPHHVFQLWLATFSQGASFVFMPMLSEIELRKRHTKRKAEKKSFVSVLEMQKQYATLASYFAVSAYQDGAICLQDDKHIDNLYNIDTLRTTAAREFEALGTDGWGSLSHGQTLIVVDRLPYPTASVKCLRDFGLSTVSVGAWFFRALTATGVLPNAVHIMGACSRAKLRGVLDFLRPTNLVACGTRAADLLKGLRLEHSKVRLPEVKTPMTLARFGKYTQDLKARL